MDKTVLKQVLMEKNVLVASLAKISCHSKYKVISLEILEIHISFDSGQIFFEREEERGERKKRERGDIKVQFLLASHCLNIEILRVQYN